MEGAEFSAEVVVVVAVEVEAAWFPACLPEVGFHPRFVGGVRCSDILW